MENYDAANERISERSGTAERKKVTAFPRGGRSVLARVSHALNQLGAPMGYPHV